MTIWDRVKDKVKNRLMAPPQREKPLDYVVSGFDIQLDYKTLVFVEAGGIIVQEVLDPGQEKAFPLGLHLLPKETLTLQFQRCNLVCEVVPHILPPRTIQDDCDDAAEIIQLIERINQGRISKSFYEAARRLQNKLTKERDQLEEDESSN